MGKDKGYKIKYYGGEKREFPSKITGEVNQKIKQNDKIR